MILKSVLFCFMSFVFTSGEEFKVITDLKRFHIVDSVLEGLQLETWSPEEAECIKDTKSILNGVKNNTLWASWAWDSMQLPFGTYYGNVFHMGNFDQCLEVPWPPQSNLQTQYCLVDVELIALNKYDGVLVDPQDDADRFIGATFLYGKRLTTVFQGVCLPTSCQPVSIAKVTEVMFRQSHLPFKQVRVDPRDCQVVGTLSKPLGYYLFWSLVGGMIFICIFVYFFGDLKKSNSTFSKVCCCFCFSHNMNSLMEVRKDEIKAMNGIRALTCGIIVLGHYFYMIQFIALVNKTNAETELTSDPVVKLLAHLDITVDTFLMMSGLLYMRGLMASKSPKPLKTLLKRYFRLLVPLYVLSIVCITYVLPHIGSGPAWPRLVREVYQPCARSWWRNFLMITNKVEEVGFCSVTSWNIHCDFQLTILATIIFIAHRTNKTLGFILIALVYCTTIVVGTIWNFWEELPGLLLYDFGPESQNMVNNKVYNTVYMPIYAKGSAYFIGMVVGYFLSVYKPQEYRNTLSKTVSIFGFVTGMSLMLWILDMGSKLFKKEYSSMWLALLATVDKTFWSVGICVIIIVCEYGTLPLINNFLGSKVFVPLSKLTYSIYLFHTMFIYRNILSLRTPATYDLYLILIHGLGYLVISCIISYLLWLFIEAPTNNLINLMFDFKRDEHTKSASININCKNEKVL